MSSGNFSKYNFDNVLVADTKLLMDMSDQVSRPQVIVLNSKLNLKCREQGNNNSSCSSSSTTTCCFQIEEPEFKRRSDVIIVEADLSKRRCFANCGDRRRLDIELSARSQLSGKVVVLALTRINKYMENNQQIKRDPLRCDTETTWAYSRFEPSSATTNETAKQTFYSRLQPNQTPSFSINTLGLQWNTKKSKETVSLAVQSNRNKKHLEVVTAETLLVIQLHCQHVNYSSDNWLYDDEIQLSPIKVHLLALINRQIADEQTTTLSKIRNGDQLNQVEFSSRRSDKNATELISEILPKSQIDYPAQQNSISSRRYAANPTKRELSDQPLSTMKPIKELLDISQRIDLSKNPLRSLLIAVPSNQNKTAANKLNGTSLLGPTYLTELDSVRLRLKSNGLLLFTISSSVIILIYTLCLLIYLKSRRRKVNASKENHHLQSQSNKRPARTVAAASPKEAELNHVPNISQPFNLQMSPATRTRLNMILGRGSTVAANPLRSEQIGARSAKNSNSRESSDCNGLASNFEYDHKQPQRESQLKLEGAGQYEPSCRVNHDTLKKSHTANKCQLAYGSVNVVRAIQQAATLARSRLRNSRYHPNLNVIPETDIEHLQSIPRKNFDYSSSSRNQNNHNQCHQMIPTETISIEQFNSLVQNAMSRDCCHNRKPKIYQQPTTTLFSKPCGLVTTCPSVSRSRILCKVKQENVYEEQNERIDFNRT